MLEEVSRKIVEAMKAKDKGRLDALRMLKSRLLENKTSKAPQAEQNVVISYCKTLKDSMESYPEGSEHIEKISKEIEYISDFMPKPMVESEVRDIILAIIKEEPGIPFGKIMKSLSPQIKGRFDGKRASELAKELSA